MGRKCSVQGCLSDSNREEDVGVTFHKVPMQLDVRSKWLDLCRISEEKKATKVIYVCSRHFLRADFCNFKGKKYLLKQGVFPSVFPWDKSKLEAIKSEKQQMKAQISNTPPLIENEKVLEEKTKIVPINSTTIATRDVDLKKEVEKELSPIEFFIDNRINALDFNDKWCPAKIKEVDEEENEVLIHFETNGNEYDEWICMDSPRLRSFDWKDYQQLEEHSSTMDKLDAKLPELNEEVGKDYLKGKNPVKYECGESCLAYWSKRKKFPATITKALENDNYEVLFEDGYVKTLKWSRILKVNPQLQSSPLFDPIQSSKQERRDKKRKINVAELFGIGKRQKTESTQSPPKVKNTSSQDCLPKKLEEAEDWESEQGLLDEIRDKTLEEDGKWLPRWVDGHPVGTESQLEFQDGTKKTVIVPDPRLPEGWAKHLTKRCQRFNAGKWETIIVSPDGKKLRSKTDIKNYLETTKVMPYDEKLFDFRIVSQKTKKPGQITEPKKNTEVKSFPAKLPDNEKSTMEETNEDEANLLKIPLVDDAYKCPIVGCDKSFRKENLAQMHVKHYHPEYSKFLDTTPNVADLAYARTVGDSLDKSPVPSKSTRVKHITPKVNQNQPNSPVVEESETNSRTVTYVSKTKDSEIIKLLNAKPYDSKSEVEPLPSGLPPSMYPVIKLKDLLSKSESIPQKDEVNLKTLSASRPPVGIKTLLPVRKPEVKNEEEQIQDIAPKIKSKFGGKRKKGLNEQVELGKTIDEEVPLHNIPPQIEPAIVPETNNVIIEGGELIKIVRMKQEEIINCTCGFMEEDGLMIQCELCLCWQHAYCNNIQKESEVPEKYICYICQHPLRQRSSKKFIHDQDWLKLGVLPVGSYHSKDEELLQKMFEKLKKSHDITGGLVEIQEFLNVLKVKQKIAKAKNHPKLYLWSKPWEKLPLPEKMEDKEEEVVKEETPVGYSENEEENQLNRDLKNLIESSQPQVPIIPQPEAAIETADCKLNLLDHILHSQNLVMDRLDTLEKELDKLEENLYQFEKDDHCSRTRQTLQMLIRDLNKLEELSQNTSI